MDGHSGFYEAKFDFFFSPGHLFSVSFVTVPVIEDAF